MTDPRHALHPSLVDSMLEDPMDRTYIPLQTSERSDPEPLVDPWGRDVTEELLGVIVTPAESGETLISPWGEPVEVQSLL